MKNEFDVSPLKKKMIQEEYLKKVQRGKTPTKEKHLTILTGLPGSGKTTMSEKLLKEDKNQVVLGSDDFYALFPNIFELYKKYPSSLNSKEASAQEHDRVEDFVCENFDEVFAKTMAQGYDIIADVQTNDSLLVYIKIAQELGYKVDVKFMTAPKRQIETNIVSRHMQGVYRFEQALSGKLPQTGANIPHHFSQLRIPSSYVEEIKLVLKRIEKQGAGLEIINGINEQILYSREKNKNPAEVFEQELNRDLTTQERLHQKSQLAKIRLLSKRITLRKESWKTTQRSQSRDYSAQVGHEKYYQHVINNLER